MIKKILIPLILSFLVFPLLVSAQVEIENPLEYESFNELIEGLIKYILWVAIALAPLLILIGAFYFLTAAGNPERIQTGKRIILWTCIGLIIILFAWGLVALIESVLGLE